MTDDRVALISSELAERVREETGENVFLCYQCVKCTSGCPLAEFFDWTPNQIMRAVQLGQRDIALESKTPWLCASCQMCTTRCPQGIDVAKVMDSLIKIAREEGVEPKVPEAALFNKVFLRDVDILGRSYELGLIAEMNLRTGNLLKDMDMGLPMLAKGKVSLVPHLARPPRHARRRVPAENEVMYYPGCSLHSTAPEFERANHAVAKALGLQLSEPPGWMCCGATPAHKVDHKRAVRMPLETLRVIEQSGFDEVSLPCAACYNRFKSALYEIRRDPALRDEINEAIGYEYQDTVSVSSLLERMVEGVGLETIAGHVANLLEGLRVVAYYGCLLTRPPEITGAADYENPTQMDRLLETLGAEVLDWSDKTRCCGAGNSLTQTGIVLELSRGLIEDARAVGADAIAVACPLCHTNLDARQTQMKGLETPMPVLYFTQLMAVAFGLGEGAAGLDKNMIDPRPVLAARGLIGKRG
jgi:heterodisulfide reductase subunit B